MKDYENEPAVNLANQNRSVVNWAKENFPKGLDTRSFDFELLIVILISPMLIFSVLAIIDSFFTGKSPCLALLGILLLTPAIWDTLGIRRRTVVYADGNGVKTRAGKNYQWSNLYFVKFHPVVVKMRASGVGATDPKRFRTELFFEDGGRASISARSRLEEILEHLPCQKEDRRGKMW
jgi:hypothetical protein